jgi:hypothetical protein
MLGILVLESRRRQLEAVLHLVALQTNYIPTPNQQYNLLGFECGLSLLF